MGIEDSRASEVPRERTSVIRGYCAFSVERAGRGIKKETETERVRASRGRVHVSVYEGKRKYERRKASKNPTAIGFHHSKPPSASRHTQPLLYVLITNLILPSTPWVWSSRTRSRQGRQPYSSRPTIPTARVEASRVRLFRSLVSPITLPVPAIYTLDKNTHRA